MADYALVIGIEKYATPMATTVQGPSLDALRFASWLHSVQRLNAANIIVLHNKCDQWEGALDVEYNAVLAAVQSAKIQIREEPSYKNIEAWQQELLSGPEEDGMLWIYWSGHGVTLSGDRWVLLCADEDNSDPTFIYLEEFRRSLLNSRFSGQRLIIDACANFVDPVDLKMTRIRQPYNWTAKSTKPENLIQLNAVSIGRTARAEKGGGLFSRLLLNELRANGWPATKAELWSLHLRLDNSISAASAGKQHPKLEIRSPWFDYESPNNTRRSVPRRVSESQSSLGPARAFFMQEGTLRLLLRNLISVHRNAISPSLAPAVIEELGGCSEFVDNPSLGAIAGRLNATAFSRAIWSGSADRRVRRELRLDRNVMEKTRRNQLHWVKNPKTMLLLRAFRINDFTPQDEYIGFSHILPLNAFGYRSYVGGRIKDNLLFDEVICRPAEKAEALLLFSVCVDAERVMKVAYPQMPRDYLRSPDFGFEIGRRLVELFCYHLQVMMELHDGGARIKLLGQNEGHLDRTFAVAGFKKLPGKRSGDRLPIWKAVGLRNES